MRSRREVLGLAAVGLLAGCSAAASRPHRHNGAVTPKTIAYGSDPSQFGELSTPATSEHRGTVVIVHGGFWQAQYDLSLGRPLAADLVSRGYTCWNLEYRRVGNGGGWPTTLQDVAAGIDHLASLDVDTARVVLVGHSAGGQLAVWAAGRAGLPADAPGAHPRVAVTGVVSQAGVLDMVTAAKTGVGGTAESDFLGGSPSAVPGRYRIADPIQRVPITPPVLCVHAHADANVPFAQSTAYVDAATKAGDAAALHVVPGDHFTLIDPTSPAWQVVVDALPALLGGRLP
ncbi:S9 family peptidase [Jatrophihabitans endophyticus]|uniref:alpha/beta hydrolase family protein n=1 Tax=Jatrophihabitans endophyticus TaxID=1206085 RepID=UPI0019DCB700|nr:alpha/beta fold hydrolase [Jatrophihabitans endophyticus]MBE7190789.1 alpha/beta fold hydrolase [Jatrophihabitans endophyticus]